MRRTLRPGDRLLGYTLTRELESSPDLWRWDAGEVEVIALRPHAVLVPGFRDGFWKAGGEAEDGVNGNPTLPPASLSRSSLPTLARGESDGLVVRVRPRVRGALVAAQVRAPNDVAAWLAEDTPNDALVEDIVIDADGVPRYWPVGRPARVSVAATDTIWAALGTARVEALAGASSRTSTALHAAAIAAIAAAVPGPAVGGGAAEPTFVALVKLGGAATIEGVAAWSGCEADAVRRAGDRRLHWALAAGDLASCLRASQHGSALGWTVEVVDLSASPPRFWMAMMLACGGNLPLLGTHGIVVGGVTITHTMIVAAGVGLAVASVASLSRAIYKLGRWRRAREGSAAWHAHRQARAGGVAALLLPDTSGLAPVVARDVAEALACARDRLASLAAERDRRAADTAIHVLERALGALSAAIATGTVTMAILDRIRR